MHASIGSRFSCCSVQECQRPMVNLSPLVLFTRISSVYLPGFCLIFKLQSLYWGYAQPEEEFCRCPKISADHSCKVWHSVELWQALVICRNCKSSAECQSLKQCCVEIPSVARGEGQCTEPQSSYFPPPELTKCPYPSPFSSCIDNHVS